MKFTAGRGIAIGGLAAAASMALLINGADAHHPEVSASSSCADGLAAVRIDSESWMTDNPGHRHNPNISISFDGAVIGSGAYLPSNDYRFSLVYATKADGGSHTVRATAVGKFGPAGEYDGVGEYRETTVTLPTNCEAPAATTTTTTSAPVTTTTGAPVTTTTAPGPVTTTTAPGPVTTTTVPVIVGGVVENRPDIAVPVEVIPRFAG